MTVPRSSLPEGPRAPSVAQLALWIARPFELLRHCQRRYGDTFTLRWPAMPPLVFVSTPAAIRQVFTGDPDVLHAGEGNAFLRPVLGSSSLLLLDGAAHLRQRRLLLPAFHGERMQSYATVMRDATEAAVDRWPLDRPFALSPELQTITLEVIVRTVFGIEQGPRLAGFARMLARCADSGNSPLLFAPALQRDLGPRSPWGRVARTIREVDDALRAEVSRRRAEGTAGRADVLSMMLEARDERGEPMTDAELRDELVTLLMAGHETTATALGWALAEILSHPEVAARIDAELRAVVGDGPLLPAHVGQLAYLDATVREVLRLRPILPVVARLLSAPMELGGHALPAGVMVMPCIYLAHRRPELYPAPDALRPERFVGARVDPYAWLPFGGGTRRCLGMAFALYEMKVVLATILLRARLTLRPGYALRTVRRGITLAPSKGAPVVMHARRPRRAPADLKDCRSISDRAAVVSREPGEETR